MRVLGLDQSFTSTGIIVFDNSKMIHAECVKTTTETDKFFRAYSIAEHIFKLCEEYDIKYIMMEGLSFGARGDATRDLGGLQYTIIIRCSVQGKIPVTIIAPTSLKKYATGSGRAKKEQVINALPESVHNKFLELGYKKTTGLQDLADAYFLGRMYEEIDNE